jgi:predicted TIM-barrel fold metal-dependent hydrolase
MISYDEDIMVVDCHVHIENKSEKEKFSASEIIEAMNQGSVDVSILLGNDQADAGSKPIWIDPELINVKVNFTDEEVADYCRHYPKRLIGLTSIHPDRAHPEKKLIRAVREFGLKGLKLYPHAGFYPNDLRLDLVYRTCIDLNIPVMIHTGIKAVRWQTMKYNNPIYVDEVATKFSDLKIIICHCGYPWVEEFFVVAYSNPNIWIDLTFIDYIEKVFKKKDFVEESVRRAAELIGTERILWGTEGPYMNLPLFGKHGPQYYQEAKQYLVERFSFLSLKDKNNILGENARRLFRIDII